jgi:hypothetical protein
MKLLRTRRGAPARGQGMTEYISIVTVLFLGGMVAFVSWPFTRDFFLALQNYIDLYFYALNVGIG